MEKFAEQWLIDNQHLLNKPLADFMRNRITVALVAMFTPIAFAVFTRNLFFLMIGPLVAVLVYSAPISLLKSGKKAKEKEIVKVFPDWISTLQTLVLIDTIPNAIRESIDSAPEIIREDIEKLANKILVEPLERSHYMSFLNEYQNPSITETMLSLYQFNFNKKEDLAYEFEVLHARMDRIAAENRRNAVQEKSFFYGMVLMAGPGVATAWIVIISLRLSMIVQSQSM